MKSKQGTTGFTLIELVIVLFIIAILSGIATTLLRSYLPNMRIKSAARDIFSAMMLAKSEAIRREADVTVLFDPVANTYTVFLDNGVGTLGNESIDPGETVLLPATVLPTGISFDPSVSADGISFDQNAVVFSRRGIPLSATPVGAASGLSSGTVGLRAVDSSGNVTRQRTITVSSAGQVSMN